MSVHPFIQGIREQNAGRPPYWSGTPQSARDLVAATRAALGHGPAMSRIVDLKVPSRSNKDVPTRLYVPTETVAGTVVYLHGGGWALGGIADYDTLVRALAHKSNCAILLPEYRLAPEHPFPAGLDDACDVIGWASRSLAEILGRRVPLVVAGDSAGANLATVAARLLKDEVRLSAEALLYPVVDCDFTTASYKAYGEGYIVSARDMQWFFDCYVAREAAAQPDVSPLRAPSLAGLPPTLVLTAQYDVLADEGRAYAARLRAEGVQIVHREVAGVTHGFVKLHNLFDVAAKAVDDTAAFIADACVSTRKGK